MVDRKKVLDFITYYNLIVFAVLALIIWPLDECLYRLWFDTCIEWVRDVFDGIVQILILVTSYGLLLVLFVANCASKYYKKVTGGRSLFWDRRDYQRNIIELLKYFRTADVYRLPENEIQKYSWKEFDGVILGQKGGNVIGRSSSAPGNITVTGLPGKGKTTSIIIPTALRFGGSVFCIDIKGDIHAVTSECRRIKVFAPGDPNISCHYDVLRGVDRMEADELRKFIEQIGFVLCPKENGENRFFSDGARNFFSGISLYLISQNPHITFPEIVERILTGNAIQWVMTIKESDCTIAKLYTDSMYGSNEKNVSGCYENLASAIRPFSTQGLKELLDGKGECISPADLNGDFDVYLRVEQSELDIYAPLLTIIAQQFLTDFLNRPSGLKPIIFLLDEFPQLRFNYDSLMTALSTLRSRNVTLLLCMQSLSQLDKLYGEAGRKSVMDTCEYYAILSVQDTATRKYFSELIGTRKVLKMTKGSSGTGDAASGGYNKSSSEARELIFQPEDFGNLDGKVIIYYKGKYIKAEQTPYYA